MCIRDRLISEPLSRLGAKVTGIDASIKNIKVAKIHAKKSDLKIRYIATSPEQKLIKEKFDVVLSLEVVEHVKNLDLFFKSSSSLLRENGIMFVATLNRTFESYLKAIIGAEYVLRWLPIGTHDWNMFINPQELERLCNKNSLSLEEIFGVKYNVITDNWHLSSDKKVNYMAKFKKI